MSITWPQQASAAASELPSGTDAVLVYDGECPVCSVYVTYVRFRESVGNVSLIDARSSPEWLQRVRSQGLNLDEGMVLLYGDHYYHGADCIHMLALLSTPSGIFNRINAAVFRRPRLASALYPVLRAGRNTLLAILGRSRIGQ